MYAYAHLAINLMHAIMSSFTGLQPFEQVSQNCCSLFIQRLHPAIYAFIVPQLYSMLTPAVWCDTWVSSQPQP